MEREMKDKGEKWRVMRVRDGERDESKRYEREIER